MGWGTRGGSGGGLSEKRPEESSLGQSLPGRGLPDYSPVLVDLGSAFGSPTGRLIFSVERKEIKSVGTTNHKLPDGQQVREEE